ncbi:MAG: hypothetical protein ACLFPE_04330 [Bacteroidales bacterium]
MIKTFRSQIVLRLFLVMLAAVVAAGGTGCKSQKKIAAEKAASERAAKIEKAKQDLLKIINDQGNLTLAEKENKVSEIKSWDLQDPEVDALISKAESAIAEEKAEMKRLEEERRREELEAQQKEEQKFTKIEDYFDAIAASKSMEMANTRINEALNFFASPDVPVLTIVYMDGDIKDYDKPTTIRKYLEYLKDQGKNPNKIHNVQFDANGKITELELIKM